MPTPLPILSTEGATSTPEFWDKLSPQAKRLLSDPQPGENSTLDMIIRTQGEMDETQRSQIEAIGATIRTIAGDVVTLTGPYDALEKLASLEFVIYIDVSAPLFPEP